MKKLIFLSLVFLGFFQKTQGQEDTTKNQNEFNLSLFGGTYFLTPQFEQEFTIPISLNLITKKSHHHLQYDPVNGGSVILINGIFINDDWDSYNYLSKYLSTTGGYVTIGVERYFELGNNAGSLIFMEVGTDWGKPHLTFDFGIIFNFVMFEF